MPRKSASPEFFLRSNPVLYEINTWAWLAELSDRAGKLITLADVPDSKWDQLATLGFDAIWLMGVWKRSAESRRLNLVNPANKSQFDQALPGWKPDDVVGSPYSVADYVPDPRIGTWTSLDAVRRKLHARKMALFLDFVGNHTALDHPWVRTHPEYYVQGSAEDAQKDPSAFSRIDSRRGPIFIALGRDPYFPPWTDVAQLNHFSVKMRAAHLKNLLTIARHCDGVRCDMAMLQLNDIFYRIWGHLVADPAPSTEFWTDTRKLLPNFILLAEAYWGTEARLLDLGFSFSYDKEMYDALRDGNIGAIKSRLNGDRNRQSQFARFLENHDEPRCAAVFGPDRIVSVGTLAATAPGMRFYHQGELEGRRIHFPIALREAVPENLDPKIAAFFAKILAITKQDAFHDGRWNLLSIVDEGDASAGNFVVYEWKSDDAWKVIAVNLAGSPSQGRIRFGDRPFAASQYLFYDEFNDVSYARSAAEIRGPGLFIRREKFDAHIFDVKPQP